jgi:outer membrane lipoprotein-sorting protein
MRRSLPLLLGLFLVRAFAQNPLTADDLIARNVQARGGMAKLAAIKTFRATYATEEDGKPVQLIELQKRPNKLRRNISIEKSSVVFAYDGQKAWQSSHGKPPAAAPADLALELKEEADIEGPLVNYKEKGSTLELVGKETLDGKDVYNLKLTLKEGQMRNVYLDAHSFLEVKETGSYSEGGKRIDFVTLLKDYRPAQGVLFPFLIEQKAGDEENQITHLKKIEINVPIADSVFAMPPH